MTENKKNIRIVDIARLAGVSAGTVDRVLHNRGKVSAAKKEKVDKVLKEIDYKPNIIARSLAMKKHYTIGVFIPEFERGSYWDILNEGIVKASHELSNFNIDVKYIFFDQYNGDSFQKKMSVLINETFDGVLIAPLYKKWAVKLSEQLDKLEIPYVYIDTNIEGQNNLAYFGANSYDSGILAAKLLLYEVEKDADILVAKILSRNNEESTQTSSREKGFMEYLSHIGFNGRIHRFELGKPSAELNKILETKNIRGGVMFNSRIYELTDLLKELNASNYPVKFIGYDLIEKNISALKNGEISFLLSQRSDMQGYNGIKSLSNYLLFQKTANKVNYMPIDILVKENIAYYNNNNL